MKTSTFVNELTKSSAVFGRKHDVKVVFTGNQAATNGETIKLPAIDRNSTMTDEQMDILRGYVDHESGHVKHTNHAAVQRLARECKANGDMHLKSVWNALEDIWLERRVIEDYPGAAHNLRATATAVNKEYLQAVKENPSIPEKDRAIGAVAITWEGRKSYGGDTCQECLDTASADLQSAVKKWVGALDHCKTTEDVIALARVVDKSLRDEDYKEEPEDEGTTHEPEGDDTGDGEGRSEPDPDNTDDPETGSDDEGTDEVGEPDAPVDEPTGDPADDDAPTSGDDEEDDVEPYNPELQDAITRMFERGEMTTGSGFEYTPWTEKDAWHHRTFPGRKSSRLRECDGADYDRLLSKMASEANSMRSKLMRSLMSKQKRDWDYGREDGRLDTKRFTQAFNGRPNVFKMRTDRSELDTAVTVLVDLSGSMSYKIMLATQCCIAICETLEKANIAYEVLGFTNPYTNPKDGVHYDRALPLDMYIFKQFDERLFDSKGALASMQHMALSDNSDGDAIEKAHDRLLDRKESRRVMLVLSDGSPACSGDWMAIDRYTRQAVHDAEKSGTDIIGLGILDESVQRYYPKYTVINDISDLAGAAMDQLARALIGERFVIDNSKLMDVS